MSFIALSKSVWKVYATAYFYHIRTWVFALIIQLMLQK